MSNKNTELNNLMYALNEINNADADHIVSDSFYLHNENCEVIDTVSIRFVCGRAYNELIKSDHYKKDALTDRVKVLEAALAKAKADADGLATSIFNRHYKEISPVGFELLDSVPDVISQIDNMSVGLLNRIDKLEGALNKIALEDFTTQSAIWFIADKALKAGK